MTGNHNTVVGEGRVLVNGNHNTVVGKEACVFGNYNRVSGTNAKVSGNFNTLNGIEQPNDDGSVCDGDVITTTRKK